MKFYEISAGRHVIMWLYVASSTKTVLSISTWLGDITIFRKRKYPARAIYRPTVSMGIYRRSKTHKGRKELSKKFRLRRRTKDRDQIVEDLEKGVCREFDKDLPGGGQFECVHCWCSILVLTLPWLILLVAYLSTKLCWTHISNQSLTRGGINIHTLARLLTLWLVNRLKELKDKPYTLEEANAAGGCGSNDFYALQMNTK